LLKDLTRSDWMDMLAISEPEVPDVLVLRGTRNLRRHFNGYRGLFTDVRELGSPNGLFEDVLIGRLGTRPIAYASVYGPAMASEIVHVFGRMGTRVAIQTGVCGALSPDLIAGDLVIATEAGCGDGAVVCYTPDSVAVPAAERLVDLARAATRGSQGCFGKVWTTAALLAEGADDIERWARAEYAAVDMETATTYGVSAWAGMEAISVLSVFDNPRQGAHLGVEESEKDHLRAAGEQRALDLVLHLAASG
jgi:uridine phosphorylase